MAIVEIIRCYGPFWTVGLEDLTMAFFGYNLLDFQHVFFFLTMAFT